MDTLAAPASRNSPCPCGSGQRYKDCHGALDRAGAASNRRRSSYRAPGTEWSDLSEDECDACGALMERALASQVAGRLDSAAKDYREVLERAPSTHDALHMAGVIELTRKNLDEAERLIWAAMLLRPRYPAIEHNMLLVYDARMAVLRVKPEELCERALPILVELALAPGATAPKRRRAPLRTASASAAIHLIGRGRTHVDDDGWMLDRIARLLEDKAPTVWASDDPGPHAPRGDSTRTPDAASGMLPRGGTHVFVGVHGSYARWIEQADAARVIVFCFGALPSTYLDQLRAIAHDGGRSLELVFPSRSLAARFGGDHTVLPPPIELRGSGAVVAPARDGWRVGAVGQRHRSVAEAEDSDFLKRMAAVSDGVDVWDPGRLRYVLGPDARIRFQSTRDASADEFVAGVSCYVHRVDHWYDESLERPLFAAMAAGVPVLCSDNSIYAEYFDHGVDGLLYDSRDQALDYLAELRDAPERAAALGARARTKVSALFDHASLARRYASLIAGPQAPAVTRHLAQAAGVGARR